MRKDVVFKSIRTLPWDPHTTNKTTKRLMKIDQTLHDPKGVVLRRLDRLKVELQNLRRHPSQFARNQKFTIQKYLKTQLFTDLIYLLIIIVFIRDKLMEFVKFRKWTWIGKSIFYAIVFWWIRSWLNWTYSHVHYYAYLLQLIYVTLCCITIAFGHVICKIFSQTTRKALDGHILEVLFTLFLS
jgi:hypothetical protein